jgi:hypothetical protein
MALADSLTKRDFRTDLCSIGKIYSTLDDGDKKAFDKALADNVPVNTLLVALQAEGYKVSWGAVNKHIKNICRCAE